MRKFLLSTMAFVAMSVSTVHAAGLDYYQTLLTKQQAAPTGQSHVFGLDYYTDGSLLLLANYQTDTTAGEGVMEFAGKTYGAALGNRKGNGGSRYKLKNYRNAFFAKLDNQGELLWAVVDSTFDYDVSASAIMPTENGGAVFAEKGKDAEGRYWTYINIYSNTGQFVDGGYVMADYEQKPFMTKEPKDTYAWTGLVQDTAGNTYLAGYQAGDLIPRANKDTVLARTREWNGDGSKKSSFANTVILKYDKNMFFVGATSYIEGLAYDRPSGIHYEEGKLYVAGVYNNKTDSGFYAARYNTDLELENIQYHPVTGSIHLLQTKFADGKIYVCGGLGKNGSITIGDKTITTGNANNNNGLVFVINQADGKALAAAVKGDVFGLTIAAYPEEDGVVAYYYGPMGKNMELHYDADMNLVKQDTLATGGGLSITTCVAQSRDGAQTALGLRAQSSSVFDLMGIKMQPENTNWYSVVAVLKEGGEQGCEQVKSENEKTVKFIRDGHLYIRHNGKVYNILGY
ncbi:MAG: hypothetical protein IJQ32_02120 [Paludibacteraceae bacterium]|nr:hypothetical protein [Paludibacteraceae bacterium]